MTYTVVIAETNGERAYIRHPISMFRFIYFAASMEFIGDCFDSSIFRILRSEDSL